MNQPTHPAYEDPCLYIDGEFVAAEGRRTQPIVNPATEEVIAEVASATPEDVDAAVAVLREARAKRSFEGERLSTHHFLIPSLLIWFFTGAPMPLRAHRWHDVWRNQRV